ncbi:thioredoxin domain-containing protein [Mucilaginibacter sp. HME9299]|uniref:Thioredoxin domain-containing protein n=2 Tax=Mucilaginibacter aquatilis TaxID=1517760 RepID=A0A6I4I3T9_9SPHI|nr:thioredoxin domain-containing protein [Mucilaginibacter aquatilis]
MKIKIWSDVMCPFCYIGKRRFEQALNAFEFKDDVQIEWKSFQLNPALETNPNISIHQYLADAKGWTIDYAKQVGQQVTEMADQVGLSYNFDNAVVANSFNAHRFTHLAKKYNKSDAAEEQLFNAYFTGGQNIDDDDTLASLGEAIGIDSEEVKAMLNSDAYKHDVSIDIDEAAQLGIRGVPFFVVNDRYAVSGAQATEVFLNTLISAYAEYQQPGYTNNGDEGASCDTDGNC